MVSYYSSEISDLVDSFKQRVREASREGDVKDALYQLSEKVSDLSADYKQRFYAGLRDCRQGAWPQSSDGPYVLGFEATVFADKKLR